MTKILSLVDILGVPFSHSSYCLAEQPEDELDISHCEDVYMWLVQRCVPCFLSTLYQLGGGRLGFCSMPT